MSAGVVGIALAGAGAEVVLTDLPHILHLTQQNLDANLKAYHRARVRVPASCLSPSFPIFSLRGWSWM